MDFDIEDKLNIFYSSGLFKFLERVLVGFRYSIVKYVVKIIYLNQVATLTLNALIKCLWVYVVID